MFWIGGVSQPAPVSDPSACWNWSADLAGSDEWGDGGDWWAAHTWDTAERWGLCSVSVRIVKLLCPRDVITFHTSAGAHEERHHDQDPPRSDLFLFPDESGNLNQNPSPTYPMLHSPLITPVPNLAQETDDFCILETPGSRGEVWIYSLTRL